LAEEHSVHPLPMSRDFGGEWLQAGWYPAIQRPEF
jgi:hypothetical protein